MKKYLSIIILVILLSSCAQESTPEPTPTATVPPTPTKEFTPTEITYDLEKNEISREIKARTARGDSNVYCEPVVWKDDLLKLECSLKGFVVEPSEDHNFLHYWLIGDAIPDVLQEYEWEKYFSENTIIEIITVGMFVEELSKTNYSTFEEIMNGNLSTKVEWVSEAEIVID